MVDFNKKLKEYEMIKEQEANLLAVVQPITAITLSDPSIVHTFEDLAHDLTQEIQAAYETADQGNGTNIVTYAADLIVSAPDEYKAADRVLFDIRTCRGTLKGLIEEKADVLIKPIRAGLDKLYEAKRGLLADLDKPLEDAEKGLKSKMAVYQDQQRAAAREAEAARLREAARLAKEATEAAARAKVATTVQDMGRELERAAMLAQQARVVRNTTPAAPPVKATGSSARVVKKWVVKDLTKLIAAVAAGKVPEMVLMVDKDVVDAYWTEDRMTLMGWDGFDVEEKTQIVGR